MRASPERIKLAQDSFNGWGNLELASGTAATFERSSRFLVLLEPDEDVRDALQVLLQGQEWRVETVGSVTDLQHCLERDAVHAVISEVRLPGCVAADVLRTCLQSKVPVVFIGHDVLVQEAVDLIRKGAIDYLEKPFSRQRLLNLLNRITKRHNGEAIPR